MTCARLPPGKNGLSGGDHVRLEYDQYRKTVVSRGKCAAAGNDIIMPGNRRDDADIRRAYERGELSEKQIRECAGRILALVKKMNEEAQK